MNHTPLGTASSSFHSQSDSISFHPANDDTATVNARLASFNTSPTGAVHLSTPAGMSVPHEKTGQGPPHGDDATADGGVSRAGQPMTTSLHRTAPVPFSSASAWSGEGTYATDHDPLAGDAEGGLSEAMAAFFQRLRETPPLTLVWVAMLVLGLMAGNAMILICVNFWLDQFPESGRYTVFAFSGMVFSLFFLSAFGLYYWLRRPSLSFLRHALSWRLLVWVGLMDTVNSALAIYAAPGTPEVLQALFASLVPVYAAVFTKLVLKDPRQYCTRYVVVSFGLIVFGVMVASFAYLGGGMGDEADGKPPGPGLHSPEKVRAFLRLVPFLPHHRTNPSCAAAVSFASHDLPDSSANTTSYSSLVSSSAAASSSNTSSSSEFSVNDTILWSLIFFVSVIPIVLMNGGQTLFMTRYTYDEDFPEEVQRVLEADGDDSNDEDNVAAQQDALQRRGLVAETLASGNPDVIHPYHADDTTVKLVMLAGGTTIQSLLTLLLFPMDALPWFGSSDSVADSWSNFKAGIDCIFHCPNNFLFCVLYCMGFLLVYVSAAYLNQYSVTLCSMVTQLAAPCTAILLVLFPVLNPSHDTTPWYISTMSACILGVGTFLYVVWDEQTSAEKKMGEVRLKMGMLGLLGREDRSAAGHSHRQASARTDASGRPVEYVLVESHEEDAHDGQQHGSR